MSGLNGVPSSSQSYSTATPRASQNINDPYTVLDAGSYSRFRNNIQNSGKPQEDIRTTLGVWDAYQNGNKEGTLNNSQISEMDKTVDRFMQETGGKPNEAQTQEMMGNMLNVALNVCNMVFNPASWVQIAGGFLGGMMQG